VKHFGPDEPATITLDPDQCALGAILKAIANLKKLTSDDPPYVKAMLARTWQNLEREKAMTAYENRPERIKKFETREQKEESTKAHDKDGTGAWRIAIRKASERPRSGAILARDGLVCRQILPLGDDDDALGLLLRRELALGAADHRSVHRHQGRTVHGDREAQHRQTNSAFHGNLPSLTRPL
jgi:hypothetical protein